MKLPSIITKQYNIPFLGAFIDSFFTSLPFLNIINSASIVVILFETIKPYTSVHAPWFTLWIFVGILFIFMIIMLALVYKLLLRSLWSFRSNQMKDMSKTIEDMSSKINEIYSSFKEEKKRNEVKS